MTSSVPGLFSDGVIPALPHREPQGASGGGRAFDDWVHFVGLAGFGH